MKLPPVKVMIDINIKVSSSMILPNLVSITKKQASATCAGKKLIKNLLSDKVVTLLWQVLLKAKMAVARISTKANGKTEELSAKMASKHKREYALD